MHLEGDLPGYVQLGGMVSPGGRRNGEGGDRVSFRRMEEDYQGYSEAMANQDEETMRRLQGEGWEGDSPEEMFEEHGPERENRPDAPNDYLSSHDAEVENACRGSYDPDDQPQPDRTDACDVDLE